MRQTPRLWALALTSSTAACFPPEQPVWCFQDGCGAAGVLKYMRLQEIDEGNIRICRSAATVQAIKLPESERAGERPEQTQRERVGTGALRRAARITPAPAAVCSPA